MYIIILQFGFAVRMFVHMFVRMFVTYLLHRLRTDWHQTWQEGQGQVRNPAWDIGFHENQSGAMAIKKRLCATRSLLWWNRLFVIAQMLKMDFRKYSHIWNLNLVLNFLKAATRSLAAHPLSSGVPQWRHHTYEGCHLKCYTSIRMSRWQSGWEPHWQWASI